MSLINKFESNGVQAAFENEGWMDARALQTVINSLSEGVIVTNRTGQVLVFNDIARTLLGIEPLGILPIHWGTELQCFLPDRRTPIPPEALPLGRCLNGLEVQGLEMFIKSPGAPTGVMVSVCSRPLRDADGVIRGGVVEFRDITGLKESEEELNRLAKAVEQTADAVLITSKYGNIEYVNPAFQVTTGYSREEVLGRKPSLLKSGHHPAEFYQKLWTTISNGEVFRGTIVNRRKDGELYWAEQTISPMTIDGGEITHYVSVLKDITEYRRQQKQEFQIGLAREVQQRYYRETTFRSRGFEVAATTMPADEVGGDYFDVLSMPEGCFGVAIGDVSGHGFGCALIMAETRAYIRSFTQVGLDAGRVLTLVNNALAADLEGGRHVTMLLACIDPQARTLVYASAGHISGYLVRASEGAVRVLGSNALPLGLFADASFNLSESISLEPGDLIVLVTDGVTEAASLEEQEFGAERLLEAVRDSAQHSVEEIVETICQAAREFAGRQSLQDDITALVCRVPSNS